MEKLEFNTKEELLKFIKGLRVKEARIYKIEQGEYVLLGIDLKVGKEKKDEAKKVNKDN